MTSSLYPSYFNATPRRQAERRGWRLAEVPKHASPHVRLLFTEMRRSGIRYDEIEIATAVRRATLKSWKHKSFPSLSNLQAAFSFVGWDYVPVPALEVLPPDLAGDITALALKMQRDVPATYAAAVAVGVEQALLNMTIAEKRAILEARTECPARANNDNKYAGAATAG